MLQQARVGLHAFSLPVRGAASRATAEHIYDVRPPSAMIDHPVCVLHILLWSIHFFQVWRRLQLL